MLVKTIVANYIFEGPILQGRCSSYNLGETKYASGSKSSMRIHERISIG